MNRIRRYENKLYVNVFGYHMNSGWGYFNLNIKKHLANLKSKLESEQDDEIKGRIARELVDFINKPKYQVNRIKDTITEIFRLDELTNMATLGSRTKKYSLIFKVDIDLYESDVQKSRNDIDEEMDGDINPDSYIIGEAVKKIESEWNNSNNIHVEVQQ
jgi:hypothetical protein